MKPQPASVKLYRESLLATWISVVLIGLLVGVGALETVELLTQDVRFRLRPPRPTSAKIMLVTVGKNELQKWSEPTTFWGARFADVLKQANSCGAKVVGFDYILAASADKHVAKELGMALEPLGLDSVRAEQWVDGLPPGLRPLQTFQRAVAESPSHVVLADDPLTAYPDPTSMERQALAADADGSSRLGSARMPADADGAIRSAWLYEKDSSGRIIPGFAALVAVQVHGLKSTDEAALRAMAHLAPGTAETQTYRIDFTGVTADQAFPSISAERLASGKLDDRDRELLHDAVVLIGSEYIDSPDMHHAGGGQTLPGLELQAQAISTLLDGRVLHRTPPLLETALALLWGVLAILLAVVAVNSGTGWTAFWSGTASVGAVGALWAVVAQIVFNHYGLLLPVAGPLAALGLPFIVFHLGRSVEERLLHLQEEKLRLQEERRRQEEEKLRLQEERRRQEVEQAFGRSVSPALSDWILKNWEQLHLEGTRGEGSVLFFDLRGSTKVAETRDAAVVFKDRNALLAKVVPIVETHDGLIYHFTGDGFMAVFGVPNPLKHHAQAAVDTAQEVVAAVRSFQSALNWSWRGGCGVHSGPLAYGMLGVEKRSEFTVVGDAVNLAARLEGLNKELTKELNTEQNKALNIEWISEVVVSVETYGHLETKPSLKGPVERSVSGREAPVIVYYAVMEETKESTT